MNRIYRYRYRSDLLSCGPVLSELLCLTVDFQVSRHLGERLLQRVLESGQRPDLGVEVDRGVPQTVHDRTRLAEVRMRLVVAETGHHFAKTGQRIASPRQLHLADHESAPSPPSC